MKTNQRLLTFAAFFAVSISFVYGQKSLERPIFFDHDKSVLRTYEQTVLREVLDSIRLSSSFDYTIELRGNTDSTGSVIYNQSLSERRCAAVLKYLSDRGISASKVNIDAFGENRPIAYNSTDKGRQMNRRVDLIVHWKEEAPVSTVQPTIPASAAPTTEQLNIDQFYASLSNTDKQGPTTFTMISSKEEKTIFQTSQGTLVVFPPGAFNVPEQTPVTITIKDFYRIEDIFAQNLNTQVKGSNTLLVSGGMVFIEAKTADGQSLIPQKPYNLMIPRQSPGEMTLYEATIPENNSTQMRQFRTGNMRTPFRWESMGGKSQINAYYDRIAIIEQKQKTLQNLYKRLTDTTGCNKMMVFRKYTYHYITLADGKKERVRDSLIVYADRRPKGFHLVGPNYNDPGISDFCMDIAEWVDSTRIVASADWQKKFRRMQRTEMKDIYYTFKATKEITSRSGLFGKRKKRIVFSYDLLLENIQKKIGELENDKNANRKIADQYREKMADILRDSQAISQIDEAAYYLFETRDMGWINCDYFWEVPPKEMVDVRTNVAPNPNIQIKLVFKRRKAIMDPNSYEGQMASFNRIPRNEEAVIVAFTVREGKAYVAMQDIVTSGELVSLSFKPLTPEELKEKLQMLN